MNNTKSILTIIIVTASLLVNAAYAADPTLHEVYQAAESGNLKKAQSMMDQVLRDHPNSAKAHFVEAELLIKEGRLDMAKAELGTAERLAPGLPFAKPESVNALRQKLHATSHPETAAVPQVAPSHSDFPWIWVMGGGLLLVAFIFFVRSSNRPQVIQTSGGSYAAGSNGFGNPYPQPVGAGGVGPIPPPASGGIASGLLGGLATGAAVGAGIVAGEALMHKVLGGGQSQDHVAAQDSFQPIGSFSPIEKGFDMGGNNFGVADSGSWDDEGSSNSGDEW